MKRGIITGFLIMAGIILIGAAGILSGAGHKWETMSELTTVSGDERLLEKITVRADFYYEQEAEEVTIEKGESRSRFFDWSQNKYRYGWQVENRIRGLTEGNLKEFEWNGETRLYQVSMTTAEASGRYCVVLERSDEPNGRWSGGTLDDLNDFRSRKSDFIVAEPEYGPFPSEDPGIAYVPKESSLMGGPGYVVCTETLALAADHRSGKDKLYFTASMQEKRRNLAAVYEVSDWAADGTATVRTAAEWDLTGLEIEIRCLGVRDGVILLGFLKYQDSETIYACIRPYFMEEGTWGEEYRICEVNREQTRSWVMKMDSSEGVIQTACYIREYPYNTGGENWENPVRALELVSYETGGRTAIHDTLKIEGLCNVNSICRVDGITYVAGTDMYEINSPEDLEFWIMYNRYNRSGIAAVSGFQAGQFVRAFDGEECVYSGRWRSRFFESILHKEGGYVGIFTVLSE